MSYLIWRGNWIWPPWKWKGSYPKSWRPTRCPSGNQRCHFRRLLPQCPSLHSPRENAAKWEHTTALTFGSVFSFHSLRFSQQPNTCECFEIGTGLDSVSSLRATNAIASTSTVWRNETKKLLIRRFTPEKRPYLSIEAPQRKSMKDFFPGWDRLDSVRQKNRPPETRTGGWATECRLKEPLRHRLRQCCQLPSHLCGKWRVILLQFQSGRCS